MNVKLILFGYIICQVESLFCGVGKYYNRGRRRRSGKCLSCTSGTYLSATQHQTKSCTKCPSGKYNNRNGSDGCINVGLCPVGTFGPIGSTSVTPPCKACPIGKYQDGTGQDSCNSCPSGMYTTQLKTAICTGGEMCAPGKYGTRFSTSQGSCYPCKYNTYTDHGGMFDCHTCPSGKWQPKTGQDGCIDAKRCGNYKYWLDGRCITTHPYVEVLSGMAWFLFVCYLGTIGVDGFSARWPCLLLTLIIGWNTTKSSVINDRDFYMMVGFLVFGAIPITVYVTFFCTKKFETIHTSKTEETRTVVHV